MSIKSWDAINYRYFVQESGDGWGVCDSNLVTWWGKDDEQLPFVVGVSRTTIREYQVDWKPSLRAALELAIELNEKPLE